MERCQRAGDKSEELSVRTDNMSVRTDNMDDSMLELASQDHNTDDDGTLSDNDDNVSYGDDTLYDVEEEEEDHDDDLAYTPQRAPRAHPRVEERAEVQDERQRSNVEDDDLSGYGGADFHREEAESFMNDLISQCERNGRMSAEQHKDSLMQLNSKWQQIMDQIMYDQERQIESIVQERNESELSSAAEANGLRRMHEEEIATVKDQVMVQSQKIILQEMKVNAERERKYEEAFESRVEEAVDETKQQMSDEFDITLSGMKSTQEKMKQQYENMLKETEIRVQDEVARDANKVSDSKVTVFMMQYEEMKTQVVDLTMEIQTLEMAAESKAEDNVLEATEKDNQIDKLKANIDKRVKTSKMLISQMRDTHSSEVKQLQAKISELLSSNEQRDAEASKGVEQAYSKSIQDLKMAQAKIKDLLSKNEKRETETSESEEQAHAKVVGDLKKVYQMKIEEMALTEEKNIERMQKALNKGFRAELLITKKKIEEGNAALAKSDLIIKKEKSKITAVRKEHNENIQKLKKEHKVKVERSNANALFAQKAAEADRTCFNESKMRLDEHAQTLQVTHEREVNMLKMQLKEEKAGSSDKYDSIISGQKTKISSLQTLNNEFTEKLKLTDANESKIHTDLKSKVSSLQKQNNKLTERLKIVKMGQSKRNQTGDKSGHVDESQGALASLQRDVEVMKRAANKRSNLMTDLNNTSVTDCSEKMSHRHTKTIEKENGSKKFLLANGKEDTEEKRQQRIVLPTEIQLQHTGSEELVQDHYDLEEKEKSREHPDAASNCSTILSSRNTSPTNLPASDAHPFPDLSPITFGSPTPQRKSRKKSSKVAPYSQNRIVDKVKPKLDRSKSQLSPRRNSSKFSHRSHRSKSPASVKSQTIIVAPKSLRTLLSTPHRRRRDSLSSWGSSFTQLDTDDMRLMILNVPITNKLKKVRKFDFKI